MSVPGASVLGCALGAGVSSWTGNNGTHYDPLTQNSLSTNLQATEAAGQVKMRGSCVLSKLGALVTGNARAGTTTIRTRINGSNGNQVLSIGAGATGYFEDTTNTDAIADGDLFCTQTVLTGGSAANLVLCTIGCQMVMDAGNAVAYLGQSGSSSQFSSATASTSTYLPVAGGGISATTDSDTQRPRIPCAGDLSSLQCYVSANGRSTTTTFTLRVNGSDVTNTLSIGSGATGLFEDTTHTDTIALFDKVGFKVTTGTGTGTITIPRTSIRFVGAADEVPLLSLGREDAASGTRYATGVGGSASNGAYADASETQAKFRLPYDCVLKNIYGYNVSSSSTGSITARKGGSDTSLLASWASSANFFSDTSIEEAYTAGDDFDFKFIFSGASNTRHAGVCLSNPPIVPEVVQTGTDGGDSGATEITFGAAPTTGNLIIATFAGIFTSGIMNTTDWTILDSETSSDFPTIYSMYRYVEPGDSATLPAFTTTTGFNFWAAQAIEITNVSGDPTEDIQAHASSDAAPIPSPYSVDTPHLTTTGPNQMYVGMMMLSNLGSPTTITVDSPYTLDIAGGPTSTFAYGYATGTYVEPSSGISQYATFNFVQGSGSAFEGFFGVIIAPPGAPPVTFPVRLPLIALEAVTGGTPSAEVPLIASEPLTGGNPSTDLSLISADALTGGNPYVYNPLIVLEALYGLYTEVPLATEVFPTLRGLGWSVHKKPMFATKISEHVSGREVRASFMQYPKWDFELTFEFLKDENLDDDLREIMGFYLNQLGRFNAWLYKDPTDYHAVNEQFGIGDGVTLEYLALRSLGGFREPVGQFNFDNLLTFLASGVNVMNNTADVGANEYATGYGPVKLTSSGALPTGLLSTKNYWLINAGGGLVKFALTKANALAGTAVDISAIGSGTNTISNGVAVYDNGALVDPSDYTLVAPNRILFDVAPDDTHVLTADFDYYFQCRFSEDQQDYENFMYQLWTLQECTFRSIIDE